MNKLKKTKLTTLKQSSLNKEISKTPSHKEHEKAWNNNKTGNAILENIKHQKHDEKDNSSCGCATCKTMTPCGFDKKKKNK